MMGLYLVTKEIKFNIMNISHMEVAGLEPEARYLTEAGTEKSEEVERAIVEGEALVRAHIDRFLTRQENVPPTGESGSNEPEFPSVFRYEFRESPRRYKFRFDTLAKIMQSAIIDISLGIFYSSVGADDLAKKHNGLAEAGMLNVEKLFYEKNAPVPPERK